MPKSGYDGQVYFGLDQTINMLCEKDRYKDESGNERHIDRLFIDANYGNSTKTVYKFCKESKHSRIMLPYHGRFISVRNKPFQFYRKVRGEINGHHWRIPLPDAGKIRHINSDINYWKSFMFNCLHIARGDAGALTLYGDNPAIHKMFGDQLRSETCMRVSGNDRVVDEWKLMPSHPDNHFLDCLVGCYVAASCCGVNVEVKPKLPNSQENKEIPKKKKQKVSYIQF
jgi:hypothetical protein